MVLLAREVAGELGSGRACASSLLDTRSCKLLAARRDDAHRTGAESIHAVGSGCVRGLADV